MKSVLTILLLFIVSSGCKRDNPSEPIANTVTSGKVTIDTRRLPTGFSFVHGDTISVPNPENILPDFEFYVKTRNDPRPVGVHFAGSRPSYQPTFCFKHFFSTLDSAKANFQNLNEVIDTAFTVEILFESIPYQIYTVKTYDGKYAKILITDNGPNIDTSYATCSFDWTYQSNGSRHF
jgi:hypothetical protein